MVCSRGSKVSHNPPKRFHEVCRERLWKKIRLSDEFPGKTEMSAVHELSGTQTGVRAH